MREMTRKIAEALFCCLLLGCVQVPCRHLLDATPTIELSYEVSVSTLKKTRMYKPEMDKDVHNSLAHLSSKLEITPIGINRTRDTDFWVYSFSGVPNSKENGQWLMRSATRVTFTNVMQKQPDTRVCVLGFHFNEVQECKKVKCQNGGYLRPGHTISCGAGLSVY